jgi:hypothetical protein
VLSIVVFTELSTAAEVVAVEHAGEASARAGSAGTAVPFPLGRMLVPVAVAADEPARPNVQPAQTSTPAARGAVHASDGAERDIGTDSPMP